MSRNIEADEITRAKRRRRCVTDCLSGHLIDLGRRKATSDHLVDRRHHPKNADAVGDEIWPVLCRNHAFAKPLIEKARNLASYLAARF